MEKVDLGHIANRREQFLFLLVVLFLFFLFLEVVALPKYREVRVGRERFHALKTEQEALIKFMERTPAVRTTPSSPGKTKEIKLEILDGEAESSAKGLSELLPRITDFSFLKGVQIEAFSFQPDLRETGYTQTDFTLETTGGFNDLVGYLERLERFPALFQARDIVMKVSGGDTSRVHAEITGRFFVMGGSKKSP
ncbi:MAG: hypothetical protein HY542_02570 [Deltaproteobacteria bacterium]|nr:hypothetical protein [Deltaproteobacteria bacterium]